MVEPSDNSTTETAKPARRGPVSGLFWLIVLAVMGCVTAVGLSFWVPQLQRDRAIERIRRLGGRVTVRTSSRRLPDRLLKGIRGDTGSRVIAIDLSGADLTDDDMRYLEPFPHVVAMSLAGERLSPASLETLKEMPSLQSLMLINCTGISDADLAALQKANPKLRIARRGSALLGIFGRPGIFGCQVVQVSPGTAAAKGGLMRGDEITQIDQQRLNRFETLVRVLARYEPGDTVMVYVRRRGERLTFPIELGRWGTQLE